MLQQRKSDWKLFVQPRERIIDMSPEEQMIWENEQLDCEVDFSRLKVIILMIFNK